MLLKEGNQQRLIFYLKHTLSLREIPMTLSSSNSSLETNMKIENSGFPVEVIKLKRNKPFIEIEKPNRPIFRLSSVKTELVHCVRSVLNKTIVRECQQRSCLANIKTIQDCSKILHLMLEISLRDSIKCIPWIKVRSRLLCAVVRRP